MLETFNVLLHEDLKQLRKQWDAILHECKLVAENTGIEPMLPERRQRSGSGLLMKP